MSEHHKRLSGSARQRRNATVFATHGDVCHICGHPGADAVDHVEALARGGSEDFNNLRPAHHDTACPTCGQRCNRAKGDKPFAPIIKHSGSLNRPRG